MLIRQILFYYNFFYNFNFNFNLIYKFRWTLLMKEKKITNLNYI